MPCTLPSFRTEADRDARYAEWVVAGNSMAPGLMCRVSGRYWRFDGRHWQEASRG